VGATDVDVGGCVVTEQYIDPFVSLLAVVSIIIFYIAQEGTRRPLPSKPEPCVDDLGHVCIAVVVRVALVAGLLSRCCGAVSEGKRAW
jgi:hypothetical protein